MTKNALTALLLLSLALAQAPASAGTLYYILDGSGSMWGRIDGRMKIEAARDAMVQLIGEMPPDIDSGLTVYGHRKKGDCGDIAQVIPTGRIDRNAAIDAIRAIRPMGKTPIAGSIQETAAALGGMDGPVTIVLVSDGIETCGGDPCAVAGELAASRTDLVLHVVGLDVDADASKQLTCIAEAGRGRYFPIASADELLLVLSSVQSSVVENIDVVLPAPPDPEPIRQTVSGSSTSIRIKAKGPGRIAFKQPSWLKSPRYWMLIDPETGEEKGRFSSLETTLVPEGEYQIVWLQYEHGGSPVALTEVIQVRSGKTAEVLLETALQLNLPSWVQPPRYWGLKHPETGETVALFNRLEPFLVPAGTYDLVWRQSEHDAMETFLKRITVEPDVLNHVDVAAAIDPGPADWVPERIHYWGLKPADRPDTGDWAAWFAGRLEPQLVPAGTYHLFVDFSEHGSSDSLLGTVTIQEGSLAEFKVNTGVGFIPPKGLAAPYRVEFIELDSTGKETRTVWLSNSFGPMPLKPGTYRINYRQSEHGSSTMTIVDAFDLPEGAFVEIEL